MIGLQTTRAAMAGQPLGTLGRLRAGLTGIALAVPGVAVIVWRLNGRTVTRKRSMQFVIEQTA